MAQSAAGPAATRGRQDTDRTGHHLEREYWWRDLDLVKPAIHNQRIAAHSDGGGLKAQARIGAGLLRACAPIAFCQRQARDLIVFRSTNKSCLTGLGHQFVLSRKVGSHLTDVHSFYHHFCRL